MPRHAGSSWNDGLGIRVITTLSNQRPNERLGVARIPDRRPDRLCPLHLADLDWPAKSQESQLERAGPPTKAQVSHRSH